MHTSPSRGQQVSSHPQSSGVRCGLYSAAYQKGRASFFEDLSNTEDPLCSVLTQ